MNKNIIFCTLTLTLSTMHSCLGMQDQSLPATLHKIATVFESGHINAASALLKSLIKRDKTYVNQKLTDGNTLLIHFIEHAQRYSKEKEYRDKCLDLINEIIKTGAEVNLAGKNDQTPLIHAVKATLNNDEKIKIIKLLREHGADLAAKDSFNNTALNYAQGEPEIIAALT